MATIRYTIIDGTPPFTVELSPSSIPVNIHTSAGTYEFADVPNGEYNLIITDSNDCVFEKYLNINPLAPTTTTTTLPPDDSIIVGHTHEISLIFNENATNQDGHYTESPDDIATLYLWLKTTNGEPLTTTKAIGYSFVASGNSTFVFNELSDQINAEVAEGVGGPSKLLTGGIILKPNFIETYFKYTFTQVDVPDFTIQLDGYQTFNSTVPVTDAINIYGITNINNDNAQMNF